eukprot:CAMPEP_0119311142 /NCGR_PEP_ID=MMETSP1333-20130426/21899_1 /TAXON_ID=418940 /ORGANISM="Scyphosphaera apsteinii, Strain RCC1455" /LENGTH=192 /DNA_ID=CAMNT_0007315461 /DNA_START=109 /DNA_END=684 /DNA_ORIENTATION=-
MQRAGNNINRLTTAPALPAGWHKAGPGLWKHENGEESRINPASLMTNTNFAMLQTADASQPAFGQVTQTAAGSGRQPGDLSASHQEVSPPELPLPEDAGEEINEVEAVTARWSIVAVEEGKPQEAAIEEWYYYGADNQRYGPVSAEAISRLYDNRVVHDHSYVWTDSMEGWSVLVGSPLVYVPTDETPDAPP